MNTINILNKVQADYVAKGMTSEARAIQFAMIEVIMAEESISFDEAKARVVEIIKN